MADWQPISSFQLPEVGNESHPVLVWDGEDQTVAHCTGYAPVYSVYGNNLLQAASYSWWVHNSYGYNEDGEIPDVIAWKPLDPPPPEGFK